MSAEYKKTEHRIQKAVTYLIKNPEAKQAKVARQFDVPPQRLRSRVNGRPSKSLVRGQHNKRLSPDQETALEIHLRKMIDLGLHPRLNVIQSPATKLLLQGRLGSNESTPPPPFSNAWSCRWLKRHSEFKKTKRKPIAAVRKNAEDSQVIKSHFHDFRAAIRRHGICREDIWNFDETGFRLGIARSDWVLISSDKNVSSRVLSKDPDNRENLTAVKCINAISLSIPSFLIFTGAMIMNS